MTKDIIRMAKEAGLFTHKEVQPELVAFAALVAERERKACIDAMMQTTAIAVDAAMALEREACARLCESADKSTHPADLANVIRERGTT